MKSNVWKEVYDMPDWTKTMQQTFEYYVVDPGTWRDVRKIEGVLDSTINRDLSLETLGSASITTTESIGECYIRIYLVTIQNGLREKHPLGTFLVQSPSYSFDGKSKNMTLDAYTPLLELKENPTPLGYSILKDENILDVAYGIVREQVRAPVVKTSKGDTLNYNFVANIDDTWVTFIRDLLANADYSLALDEIGRIYFEPEQETMSLQPRWTYDDSNSSILYPELTVDRDLYGIPNVVEVIYSNGTECFIGRAVNDDPSSPTSTVNRGREITHRESNPNLLGNPNQKRIQEYAEKILKELSSLEYTVTYTHGYCPVRIGDCVRLNYSRAGINNVKAKVISQNIKCEPGCPVTEKAVFTTELWR